MNGQLKWKFVGDNKWHKSKPASNEECAADAAALLNDGVAFLSYTPTDKPVIITQCPGQSSLDDLLEAPRCPWSNV